MIDGRLKLRHLLLVDALAEQRSILGAATQIHVTQPVATRSLQELESILGVTLFERGPRGTTPTPFGDAFIQHARAALGEVRRGVLHVGELADGESGQVTVGTYFAGNNLLLPRAIIQLRSQHPNITVVVREATPEALLNELMGGQADLILGRLTHSFDDPRITQSPLYEEPVRLVTRRDHPAQSLKSPSLDELAAYPWILPPRETALRGDLEQIFLHHDLTIPAERVECTSMPTIRQLLVSSEMIAALPILIADSDPSLAVIPIHFPTLRRKVGMTLVRGRTASPSQEALQRALRAVADELGERIEICEETSA